MARPRHMSLEQASLERHGRVSTENLSQQVRAWYGLPGEIVVDGDHWNLVKVGPPPLPHPPLINQLIRRGLPQEDRLRLSYLHELGHLQTVPLALAHAVWLWCGYSRCPGPRTVRLIRLVAGLVAHEAAWELASETYVVTKSARGVPAAVPEAPQSTACRVLGRHGGAGPTGDGLLRMEGVSTQVTPLRKTGPR
jgi:hypothetical protein